LIPIINIIYINISNNNYKIYNAILIYIYIYQYSIIDYIYKKKKKKKQKNINVTQEYFNTIIFYKNYYNSIHELKQNLIIKNKLYLLLVYSI